MEQKTLDLKTLPLVGFDLIADYFMDLNSNHLFKSYRTSGTYFSSTDSVYNWLRDKEYDEVDEDKSDEPPFKMFH